MTEASLQQIASVLGKKDHTTIIHGVEKIAEKVQTDEDLSNKIDIIKKKLSPS
jgi:chromosomal replication initiator protein